KDIEVVRYFEPALPELLADPGMIENALVNIVHNAIHAMSKTASPRLVLHTRHEADNLIVEVIDNGCGIPPEHQNSIYAPAFTLKNNKMLSGAYDASIKGTGYGLFNVKKIVEKHRGQIRFESSIDTGTRFIISFPVIGRNLTIEERIEIKKSRIITNKKILVVEDEPSIFDVQSMILQGEPFFHEVDVAQNGSMAMNFLVNKAYDLVSLDYLLPGGTSGMDLYKTIRESNAQVPVLFISGNIEFLESIISLTRKDPFLDYLSKPCQNKAYVESINQLLEKSLVQGRQT
ncbi:MAG: response regulator, partial [Proteobacteria bacterium]|nr:response regulator [Pseudomonadota bacterium]